jgi:hypothetical protein
MIINNFPLILPLLTFESPGDTYIVQVMVRKKDGGTGGDQNYRMIREYYVESVEYLENKFDEIAKLCEVFNARAYINLNRRNTHALGPLILSILADKMQQPDPNYLNLMSQALGRAKSNRRVFVVDVDNTPHYDTLATVDTIKRLLQDNVVVRTPNGFHVLAAPFDVRMLESLENVTVHKNNPTILYTNLVDS